MRKINCKNHRKLLRNLIAVLFLCSAPLFAQTAKFRWTTDLCEYEGVFDQKKYTRAQLQNTLKMMLSGSFDLGNDAVIWKFEEIANLNVAALDAEFDLKTTQLKNLDIVNSAYWKTFKQRNLTELEQVYELSKTTMLAYKNPAEIKQYTAAESCVNLYAEPLINGGDELLKTWRQVNETSRRNNGNPNRLQTIFEQQLNSPDKFKYARIEVMTFGWWNCANKFVERAPYYDEQPQKEFNKLFKTVKTIGCDEP